MLVGVVRKFPWKPRAGPLSRDIVKWRVARGPVPVRTVHGGKMSSAEHLRRQKVLEELNYRLTADAEVGLSITGHRIPIQGMRRDFVRAAVQFHKPLLSLHNFVR